MIRIIHQKLNITTTDNTKHAAYADDINFVGKVWNVITWWKKSKILAPKIRYFPKANKSWLTVKPEKYGTAKGIFKDTNLNIINEDKRHYGTVVGMK